MIAQEAQMTLGFLFKVDLLFTRADVDISAVRLDREQVAASVDTANNLTFVRA